MKAGSQWNGASVEAGTQEYENGTAVSTTGQFRAYDSREQSFRGLCIAAAQQPALRRGTEHRQQRPGLRRGLQRGGYATDPDYATQGQRGRQQPPAHQRQCTTVVQVRERSADKRDYGHALRATHGRSPFNQRLRAARVPERAGRHQQQRRERSTPGYSVENSSSPTAGRSHRRRLLRHRRRDQNVTRNYSELLATQMRTSQSSYSSFNSYATTPRRSTTC